MLWLYPQLHNEDTQDEARERENFWHQLHLQGEARRKNRVPRGYLSHKNETSDHRRPDDIDQR